jgi:hypothetical protein
MFVAAENRLLREALSRMLVKDGDIEVPGMGKAEPFRSENLLKEKADILLLTSRQQERCGRTKKSKTNSENPASNRRLASLLMVPSSRR